VTKSPDEQREQAETDMLAAQQPRRSELLILPWKCPFCIGGIGPNLDGDAERCMHCSGIGLTDDPCGPAERAPRPPGVMRAPCGDCAFRRGSPELENQGVQLPDDEPFFCHQGLPISALGRYTPVATFRGLPLGAMVCAGWWALRTGEPLPTREYREIPVHEDEVEKRWAPKTPRLAVQADPTKE
jgi:hypothetical protein